MSLNNFLKQIDPETHKEYVFEKFKGGHTGKNYVNEMPEDIFKTVGASKPVFKTKVKIGLPSAFDEPISERYLQDRAIFSGEFYYAKNFKEFVNTIKPNSFDSTKYGEQRIVIPLYYEGNLIGIQGRALSTNPIKYLTIMLDDEAPKIYGLDSITKDSPVFITEGPFDSTFISNAIAMCGADADISIWGISNPVWVYDNEPRNSEIVNRIRRAIDKGDSLVIWPNTIREKDINDMVLAGHDVQKIIDSNTHSGLEAKLKFNTWKKI
jgi:hypothetical protein